MLLIFITFVLSNNLPLTFLCFPFWDSKIVLGVLVTLGSRLLVGKPCVSVPLCLVTYSRVIPVVASPAFELLLGTLYPGEQSSCPHSPLPSPAPGRTWFSHLTQVRGLVLEVRCSISLRVT